MDSLGVEVQILNTSRRSESMMTIVSDKKQKEQERVPIYEKVTLTIKEAAEYSNIGINKLDALLKMPRCPFVLYVGHKKLVKRKEFEKYISENIQL